MNSITPPRFRLAVVSAVIVLVLLAPCPVLAVDSASTTGQSGSSTNDNRVRLTGTFQLDLMNRNEFFRDQDRALPNNFSKMKLALEYTFDPKNKLLLEDQAIRRRRNELVQENYLTLKFERFHSPATVFTIKDVYNTSDYPENRIKDYRDNLIEASLARKENDWDRRYTLSFEKRSYPQFSRADYNQSRLFHEGTHAIRGGTLFGSLDLSRRDHGVSGFLDYRDTTMTLSFNRAYPGNKSDLTVSDTHSTRRYEQEEVNLFRATYWDNQFSVRYELPTTKMLSWVFEGEHLRRQYPSDILRGYGQQSLTTTARYSPNRQTRTRFSHRYINNDEESREQANRNHLLTGMWERQIAQRWKVRLEESLHRRFASLDGLLDFHEQNSIGKITWQAPSKVELSVQGDVLDRIYNALHFSDYRISRAGIVAAYVKPGVFDWQLEQFFRTFSHRNGRNVATDWIRETQPVFNFRYNIKIDKNLRFGLQVRREKTYFRTFDPLSLDMLWDFTRPVDLSEYTGSLEYTF